MALSTKTKRVLTVSMANKVAAAELAAAVDAMAANVAKIAVPGTATAADCANKINEVIQALIAAGVMAP